MSNEIVEVLNRETGERGHIRRKLFENPRINNGILVEVDASQKPYVPELWKSKIEDEENVVYPYRDGSIAVSVEDDVKAYDDFLETQGSTNTTEEDEE